MMFNTVQRADSSRASREPGGASGESIGAKAKGGSRDLRAVLPMSHIGLRAKQQRKITRMQRWLGLLGCFLHQQPAKDAMYRYPFAAQLLVCAKNKEKKTYDLEDGTLTTHCKG